MPAKFVPRQRKHRVLDRQKAQSKHRNDPVSDPNETEIIPSEHDARRDQLRSEIRAEQSQPAISSKKRKRLDKYVDTKLKKEENLDLIKKLAAHKVDTSLFRSAKKLGRGNESQRERLERALQERARGINVSSNEAILFEKREVPHSDAADDDMEEEEQDTRREPDSGVPPSAVGQLSAASDQGQFGSGLKRPLEMGEDGKPMIKKRKRRKLAKPTANVEPAWEGFSSEGEGGEDVEEDEDESGTVSPATSEDESIEDDGSTSADEEEEEEEEEDTSEETSDEDTSPGAPEDRIAKSSAFKTWATEQRNTALGFVPSAPPTLQDSNNAAKALANRRPQSPEPLPSELVVSLNADDTRRAVSVLVPRTDEVQEARLKLPVVQEEQKIMEAVHNNPAIVVWGTTGSGKTTQVPQMMFESGYGSKIGEPATGETTNDRARGMIGVTQPRRVAAVSVAERVATEMGAMKNRVGHQVRFDTSVSKSTAIKFMTDGILLREIANDFSLSKYSAIVIDEAHERSVNTDILIGLMSRIVDLRADLAKEKPEQCYPLKLVIMSATLRVEDFTKNQTLFRQGPPPIVQAEGRQYPVTEHFARRTQRDYLDDMFGKISRGHKKLPPGGMLVFLTGQNEIITLAKRLQQAFPSAAGQAPKQPRTHVSAIEVPLEAEDFDDPSADRTTHTVDNTPDRESEDEIHGLDDEDEDEFVIEGEAATTSSTVHVLPLYSQLPTKQQMRVFDPAPEGSRLIVLATNVAETSLTIPGIRYVFDCGRSKEKRYEASTGVQTFEVGWISKASAAQRAGRAGRTGPGHCYRLYSSAVYERDFEEYAVPEILRSPVENVALLVKNVDFPNVANFPFPTPPDRYALAKAEDLLKYLGAISASGKITDAGRALASYPLNPRYGRMLLMARAQNLIPHTIALVAALAIPELLLPQNLFDQSRAERDNQSDSEDERHIRTEADNLANMAAEQRLKAYNRAQATLSRWDDRSDAMKLLTAVALCAAPGKATARGEEFFIREKGMKEALELRHQLARIVRSQSRTAADTDAAYLTLSVLEPEQRGKLKYILAAGFVDQVAVRADLLRDAAGSGFGRKPRRAIEVAYRTLFPSSEPDPAASANDKELQRSVFVHPSSVLARLSIAEMPSYVIYSHLSRASPATVDGAKTPRTRMHPLGTVSAKQLVALAEGTPLLEIGKPIGKIEQLAREDGRERRACWVGLSLKGKGELRWPVGSRKEVQCKRAGEWLTERVIG